MKNRADFRTDRVSVLEVDPSKRELSIWDFERTSYSEMPCRVHSRALNFLVLEALLVKDVDIFPIEGEGRGVGRGGLPRLLNLINGMDPTIMTRDRSNEAGPV